MNCLTVFLMKESFKSTLTNLVQPTDIESAFKGKTKWYGTTA
ncbi:hypothetical protein SLW70_12440 [Flavobacterium sp. NG2]|nr:hypothetical protein [Flavobacterium sp. NG2]WPR70735.1 hypothetical protein SLW70_12440 [Flavobacterium sp. NG2]